MVAAGGVALLAVAAGLMAPPSAPKPSARTLAARATGAAQPPMATAMREAPPAAPFTPAMSEAPVTGVLPPPRPNTDPTTKLAQAVSQHAPRASDQRDLTARAEPDRARVGETDLGLRLMPGSRPLPNSSRRVPDGAGGEALALSLVGNGTLDAAVQFYRQHLVADGLPSDAVRVIHPRDGQALLRAPSPHGGERTVWIVQKGSALEIVLALVRPAPTAQR